MIWKHPLPSSSGLTRGESGTGVSAQTTNPLGRPVRARGLLRAAGAADRLSPHRERAGVALRPRGRCTSLSTVGVCCDERTSAQVSNPPSCAPPASASRAREPAAIIPLLDWGDFFLHSFCMRLRRTLRVANPLEPGTRPHRPVDDSTPSLRCGIHPPTHPGHPARVRAPPVAYPCHTDPRVPLCAPLFGAACTPPDAE